MRILRGVFLGLTVLSAAAGADQMVAVPATPIFTIGGAANSFFLSFPQDFEVISIDPPLSLSDRLTGRPADVRAVSVSEVKSDNASPRLHAFAVELQTKALKGSAFDGSLGVVYKSAGQSA